MKLKIDHTTLSNAVSKAEKITAKNTTLPILKCILLDVGVSELVIRSTNLDLGVEITIPASGIKKGRVAVPGDVLNSFLGVKALKGEVLLESDNTHLAIRTEKESVKLRIFPDEDFPTIPTIKTGTTITLPPKVLVEGLRSVWYSASPSSMKPELSSIFITGQNSEMVFAATDSFRLAEKRIPSKRVGEGAPILIPLKNTLELIRNLEHAGDGDVDVIFNNNQLSVTVGNVYLTSRIIDGTFPDYQQVIPKNFVTEAVVLKQDLLNTLKTSNIFINRFNQIQLSIDKGKKEFIVETSNPERGESTTKIDAAISGDTIEAGFNNKYLADCLQSIATDSVVLKFGGIGKPLVITGVGDTSFTYLIMPMNR